MAARRSNNQRSRCSFNPQSKIQNPKSAFTLIELLVVVAIIAVLISILLPALSKSRANAKAVICMSNLKNCGAALMQYATAYAEWLPVAYNPYDGKDTEPNWNGALIHLNYIKDYEPLFCPSAPPVWKNFTPAQRDYLGYFTYGMGGLYKGNEHMRISRCWRPEASEILLDSINTKPESSSWYVTMFGKTGPVQSMRVLKYQYSTFVEQFDCRHQGKGNVLFMDFHVAPCAPDTPITAYYDQPSEGTVGFGAYYAWRISN